MKKIILAALAASVASASIAAPAAATPRNDHGRYEQVQKRQVVRNNGRKVVTKTVVKRQQATQRHFRKGERFDSRYARNYREIRNPRAYRLQDAPRGYRWVQSDNDAILVAVASGVIGAILANVF